MKTKWTRLLILLLAVALCLALTSCFGDAGTSDKTYTVSVREGENFTVEGESSFEVKKGGEASFRLTFAEGYMFGSATAGEYDAKTGILKVKNISKTTRIEITAAKICRVTLRLPTGVTVEGNKTEVDAPEGGTVTFRLVFAEKYIFKSASKGTYDAETSTLTLTNVTADTVLNVTVERVEYDVTKEIYFRFVGSASVGDSSTVANGKVRLGTTVTVVAGDKSRAFAGWYLHNIKSNIVSKDRTYTFVVTPDMVKSDALRITPLYKDINSYTYNANGGKVNTGTANTEGNTYLTVDTSKASQGILSCTLSDTYLKAMACATAFWHDGTFTRDGYVLKEYNTKADGTGEPYAPGDKFYPMAEDGGDFVLYCIWEEAPADLFTYSDTNGGVIITGYTGNAATVAIPDTLGGKNVVAIAAGAFSGRRMTTLLLPKFLRSLEDGAIVNCPALTTLYFPNSITTVTDNVMDSASRKNFKTLIVTHVIYPRFMTNEQGTWAVKISRLLSTQDSNRIIAVAGSSSFQGLGSKYLTDLLDGDYEIINLGTTRTTHGSLYLEAMKHYAHNGDIILFAPENSAYMMGDNTLYWKTVRDMNSMNNLWRYVDISGYNGVFAALAHFGTYYLAQNKGSYYEETVNVIGKSINKYGDDIKAVKNDYAGAGNNTKYTDSYLLTFNERFKSTAEGKWDLAGSQNNWKDPTDPYWVSVNEGTYRTHIRRVVSAAKTSGAKVYFGFAPSDADAMISEAKNTTWLTKYDTMMGTSFGFDGIVGSSKNYIFAHEYFHDCAFHTNNYGRTWRTYQLYTDLCAVLGRDVKYKNGDLGTDYEGCRFELDDNNKVRTTPKFKVTGIS